jgi:hypothetical protein
VNKKITVILNGYRRPHTLKAQMAALGQQTVPPQSVMFWQNKDSDEKFDYSLLQSCLVTVSNANFGVWARFAYALNATTEYVCVLDDDTIPGSKWLENCLDTIEKQEGLLGAIGVVFKDENYINYDRHGWANPNEEIKQVDIVGHSWFFKREWLGAFWREAPVPESRICGEDMHFSYSIQKYLGLGTFVPPHPKDDQEMWGSNPSLAFQYGVDKNAISVNHHASSFGKALKTTISKGFKPLEL